MLRQPRRPSPNSIRCRLPGSPSAPPGSFVEADGRPAFRLEHDVSELGAALVLRDLDGTELYRIDTPEMRLRDSLAIAAGSQTVAVVRKVLEPPFREEFLVEALGSCVWRATGRIAAGAYCVRDGRETVAAVRSAVGGTASSFEVLVGETADAALVLIVVVAINELAPPHAD